MLQFGVLPAVRIAQLQEGCLGFGKDAEEVYQNDVWIRRYKLQEEVGHIWIVLSGTLEVEGRPDRSI